MEHNRNKPLGSGYPLLTKSFLCLFHSTPDPGPIITHHNPSPTVLSPHHPSSISVPTQNSPSSSISLLSVPPTISSSMANRHSNHASLSRQLSKLTKVTTRMRRAQTSGERSNASDQLGPAIENLVTAALQMGGITNAGVGNLGSQMEGLDHNDDNDDDSDSSDGTWGVDTDCESDDFQEAKSAAKNKSGSKQSAPYGSASREKQTGVPSGSGTARAPGAMNAASSSRLGGNNNNKSTDVSSSSRHKSAANKSSSKTHERQSFQDDTPAGKRRKLNPDHDSSGLRAKK